MKMDRLLSKINKLREKQRLVLARGDMQEYLRIESVIDDALTKANALSDKKINKLEAKNDKLFAKTDKLLSESEQKMDAFFDSFDQMMEGTHRK